MSDAASQNVSSQASPREYLTFFLGDEEYAVDILKVQCIRGYEGVTPLPELPPMIKGVINLRGLIVPVMDLRVRFKLGTATNDETTAMIVLDVGNGTVAGVVDSVSSVVSVRRELIRPAPSFGSVMDTQFLGGLATLDDRMLIILDVDSMLGHEELAPTIARLPLAA